MLSGLLGPVSNLLGIIMNVIYNFLHNFGIQNIALSIVIFTFITKTLMLPLNLRQQKFTRISSRMTPELQKVQEKYKGKTDEKSLMKFREEQQAVYRKYGVSQSSGCLPLLITMPILFALYGVINNVPAHVTQVKVPYDHVGNAIIQSEEIVPIDTVSDDILDLVAAENNQDEEVVAEYQASLDTYGKTIEGVKTHDLDNIVTNLARYNDKNWDGLIGILEHKNKVVSSMSDQELEKLDLELGRDNISLLETSVGTIIEKEQEISKINGFLSFNINNAPGWGFPGILIPLLAMSLQFLQTRQISAKNKNSTDQKDNPTSGAMSSMNVIMPIMSGFFCLMLPIGVGIYWISTSVYTIIQQFILNRYLDKVGLDELIERSAEKAAKKNKYVSTSGNGNSHGNSLKEIATKQTRTIESVSEKENDDNIKDEPVESQDETSNNPTGISEIANLLKNSDNNKGAKK